MKERGILFSAPMVRAILAGTKTQTRRLVKPQPFADSCGGQPMVGHRDLGGTFAPHVFGQCMAKLVPCPHGAPGDKLWVRETWRPFPSGPHKVYAPLGAQYQADIGYAYSGDQFGARWKPSIFMPRWASRITLEVTGVKVERLQDISEEDAKAEGCPGHDDSPDESERVIYSLKGRSSAPSPRAHFMHVWDFLNAKRAPWESNPWVWAISFRRVDAKQEAA